MERVLLWVTSERYRETDLGYYISNVSSSRLSPEAVTAGTRGLFWDGPRNFEPWSDDEDDTWASTPSPNFHATPAGGRLANTDDLACNGRYTQRIFSGTCDSLAPKPRPYH
ncbi:hypothetical protein AVEN_81960-1 [Araneus ventricosus]|uniref:Uncharacterized protein n=1 Tax=Araneus ventricosus TaxID=182803 RepID=A0A4Y2ILX1_ARAVE|nr:hypothetical protein AVEN_81960-1 [Araneus ventricosus]